MVTIKVDIIGGSLSGLSTAITIKEFNKKIRVIVHEKHKKIGYNHEGRRCGEAYAIFKALKKWQPSNKSIFNTIEKIEFVIEEKTFVKPKPPSMVYILMLNRPEFIAQLGRQAVELGVEIQTNDKIKSIDDFNGDYIVDASGCPSIIKRELGLDGGLKGISYQQTLENSNFFVADTIKIIYKVIYTGKIGYHWIFPRNPHAREINLGIGIIGQLESNLKKMLEQFKKEYKIAGKINYVTGGLVPAGLQRPLLYNNILFVGDAGVGTFPFDGAGIHRAILSGVIAGKYIAKGKAEQYPHIINKVFFEWDVIGKIIIRAGNVVQKISDKAYSKSLMTFFKLIYFPMLY